MNPVFQLQCNRCLGDTFNFFVYPDNNITIECMNCKTERLLADVIKPIVDKAAEEFFNQNVKGN